MTSILIINGPNLNLTGRRETGIYGTTSFEDFLEALRARYPDLSIDLFQSNVAVPVVEVHMSSILAREEFRHTSLLAGVCRGTIMGFGMESYRLAVEALIQRAE